MIRKQEIVILGAGYAGTMAALRLIPQIAQGLANVTLIDAQPAFVERIRLHQLAAGQTLPPRPYHKLCQGTGITFCHAFVQSLDLSRQTIEIFQAQVTKQINYDLLIYALGSSTDLTLVPGVQQYADSLASLATTLQFQQKLTSLKTKSRIVVCGAGLTGLEMATELATTYPQHHITIVTPTILGAHLSKLAQTYLAKVFKTLNIEVISGETVTSLEPETLTLGTSSRLNYDLVCWAGPFTVPRLARSAGLPINSIGQIIVEPTLQVGNQPAIFAVGDAATYAEGVTPVVRMACATALPMAAHASDNIRHLLEHKPLRPWEFAYPGQSISLGRHRALIQIVDAQDKPLEQIVTGRLGAFLKQAVYRYTIWSLQLQKQGIFNHRWRKPRALLAA